MEQEFWRLTASLTDDVTIQYGADIHALTNGSGFPTEDTDDLTTEDLVGSARYVYIILVLSHLLYNYHSRLTRRVTSSIAVTAGSLVE